MPGMTRSRYRFFETEYPYFLTCTVVGWHVAVPVGGDAGGKRLDESAHHVLNGPFVAGRAGRIEQSFEKVERQLVHDGSLGLRKAALY
jgi:hypothetical protein